MDILLVLLSVFEIFLGIFNIYVLINSGRSVKIKKKAVSAPADKNATKKVPKVVDDYRAVQIELKQKEKRTPLN